MKIKSKIQYLKILVVFGDLVLVIVVLHAPKMGILGLNHEDKQSCYDYQG